MHCRCAASVSPFRLLATAYRQPTLLHAQRPHCDQGHPYRRSGIAPIFHNKPPTEIKFKTTCLSTHIISCVHTSPSRRQMHAVVLLHAVYYRRQCRVSLSPGTSRNTNSMLQLKWINTFMKTFGNGLLVLRWYLTKDASLRLCVCSKYTRELRRGWPAGWSKPLWRRALIHQAPPPPVLQFVPSHALHDVMSFTQQEIRPFRTMLASAHPALLLHPSR